MSGQVDLSPEQIKIAQEKAERTSFLRNEFLKLKTDPFQHASGEGGAVFDTGIMRYQAMQANYYDSFKPKGKNILYGIGLFMVPMFGFGYLLYSTRAAREAQLRRGEVSYRNRRYKWA